MIAKNRFDLLLAVNLVKVTQLWCNSNSTCRATHWMYIPSFKLISQSMLKKSPENADGRTDRRTDGRTLPRHNTFRFSNGRIKTNCKATLVCFNIFPYQIWYWSVKGLCQRVFKQTTGDRKWTHKTFVKVSSKLLLVYCIGNCHCWKSLIFTMSMHYH